MDYLKFEDPRASDAEIRSVNAWARKGGRDFQHHYPMIPEEWSSVAFVRFKNWRDYPQPQGTLALNAELPPEVSEGALALPAVLTPTNFDTAAGIYDFSIDAASDNKGGILDATRKDNTFFWYTWDVIAPRSASYRVTVETGRGGTLALFVDGREKILEGHSGLPQQATVFLTRGLHAITLRVTSGKFQVGSVSVTGVDPQ